MGNSPNIKYKTKNNTNMYFKQLRHDKVHSPKFTATKNMENTDKIYPKTIIPIETLCNMRDSVCRSNQIRSKGNIEV